MPIDLKAIRRELHQSPEIAFQEHTTKAIIMKHLNIIQRDTGTDSALSNDPDLMIHHFRNSPGILVEYSHGSGAYRLFRADMDALPIQENTACGFVSNQKGMMHACGHDVHMSVLLGLIQEVVTQKLERNLLFLFQPAEEGQGGAESILAEGILQQFHIEAVHALHVADSQPVGSVSSREGVFFGIPREFNVSFNGLSAHVAFPEKGRDAIAAAQRFMSLMRRDIESLNTKHKVIFHVGKISGGQVRNAIADHCLLEGTHRSFSREASNAINDLMARNCLEVEAEMGVTAQLDLLCTYDPVVNDTTLVKRLASICSSQGIVYSEAPAAMTGEDFGFLTSRYPGLLYWLGSGCEYPLHSDKFLPDEACMEHGIRIMLELATAE